MVNKRYESSGTYRGRCYESPLCGVAQNSSYFLHFSRCQRLRETSAHRRQPLFLMAEMYLPGFSCKRSDSPVLICSDWNLLVWRLSRCWDGGDRAWPSVISFMCLPLQGLLHPTRTSTSASCRESLFPAISTVFYKGFYSLFQLSPRVYFITLAFLHHTTPLSFYNSQFVTSLAFLHNSYLDQPQHTASLSCCVPCSRSPGTALERTSCCSLAGWFSPTCELQREDQTEEAAARPGIALSCLYSALPKLSHLHCLPSPSTVPSQPGHLL